jgi:hypothetical protein
MTASSSAIGGLAGLLSLSLIALLITPSSAFFCAPAGPRLPSAALYQASTTASIEGVEELDVPVNTLLIRTGVAGPAVVEQGTCVDRLKAGARGALPADFVGALDGVKSDLSGARAGIAAKALARMGQLGVLMRAETAVTPDFTYYSTCTGTLGKDDFLGLLRNINIAFPNLSQEGRDFVVYSDGLVSYRNLETAQFTGALQMGSQAIAPNGKEVTSNMELVVVAFDSEGRLRNMVAGAAVDAPKDEMVNRATTTALQGVEARIKACQLKMKTFEENKRKDTDLYTAAEADFQSMQEEIRVLETQKYLVPNTGNETAFKGLLTAAGVDWPADVSQLIINPMSKFVQGEIRGGISYPADVYDEDTKLKSSLHRLGA